MSVESDEHHLAFIHTLSDKIEVLINLTENSEQSAVTDNSEQIAVNKNSKQITVFNELQNFLSLSSDSESLNSEFIAFCESMCKKDDTWNFWREFIRTSMLPYLGLYLSMHSGNWELRLASLKMMAPIFNAFDRSYYINIIPNHLAEMRCIPQSLLDHFKNGAFVASIKGNIWSSVALDESHEMCINKDVKAAISKLSNDQE